MRIRRSSTPTSRFLRRPRSPDHARLLFHDRRFGPDGSPKPFPLNDSVNAAAQVLVSDGEFGVGSAREQAAWAASRLAKPPA